MKSLKKTKIIATLGPATSDPAIMKKMVQQGVDIFRINFSHAAGPKDYERIAESIKAIRAIGDENDYAIGILGDLQGPKLRIGEMEDGVVVNPGDRIEFVSNTDPFKGNNQQVYMNYKLFSKEVKPGERILLDDGKLIFKVVNSDGENKVLTEVIQGGALKSKKGVNLPNTQISLPALSSKDIEDAKFALTLGIDWLALSFVRHKKDIDDLRDLINSVSGSSGSTPIISKIEKPEALKNIDEIVDHSDGLMVARGDLGVEIPSYEVPLAQKLIVEKAKKASIPVIIATQMMESMIDSLTPTRAEVNDVANSVMDGADAVMLSGETSVGKHPVEVIEQMSSIIKSVEDSSYAKKSPNQPSTSIKSQVNNRYITDLVCFHAVDMTKHFSNSVICTLTFSGYTAYKISSWRPDSVILVFTNNSRVINQLALLWGVYAFPYDQNTSTDETIRHVNIFACKKGFIDVGDKIISLTSMPIQDNGKVNTVRITEVLSCDIELINKGYI